MMVLLRSLTLVCLLGLLLTQGAIAQESDLSRRFAAEQALVAQLAESQAPEDQRQLAELYRDGLIFSATNPIRKADRDAAITAYRRAIELGDRSQSTIIPLGRLLLRREAGLSFQSIAPDLERLALEGNGDALYLMATDALENRRQSFDDLVPRLEAAAVLGSVSAIKDLAASGRKVGQTLTDNLIARLSDRANQGSASAALSLFKIHSDGILVEARPQLAMTWLQQAADTGDLEAVEHLAHELVMGQHISADPVRAAALFREAAESGSRVAALALGNAGISASGMPVSDAEARIWLQRASEAGIRSAGVLLSNLDLKLALDFVGDRREQAGLIEAALAPVAANPEALSDLASQHWRSAKSELIGPVLMPMLERLALEGSSTAALALDAWLEANGRPLPDMVARAMLDSLRKTPLVSVGFSNFTVANLALNGRIPESVLMQNQALRLLFKAADADVGQAMLRLGQLYRQGDQLARSDSFARRWFLKAQARAVERAYWELADMQAYSPDRQERQAAEDFYRREIEAGDPRAGLALVALLLRFDELDGVSLERARSVLVLPTDQIALASMLFSTGRQDHMAKAGALLKTLDTGKMTSTDLVSLGRLRAAMATNLAEAGMAVDLLKQAAASGAPVAKTALAATYLSSVSYREEAKQAIAMLQEVLTDNPNDPEARLILARAYMMGLGVDKNAAKAEALIAQVRAESGFKLPKASLLEADWMAFSAAGHDPQGAEALLRSQAARGSSAAYRALGEYALNGFGAAIRPDAAAVLMHRAALGGDKEAMAALGHMLLNGYGLNQSRQKGIDWLTRAANAGNTAAMYELSRILSLKQGPDGDPRQAVIWLQKAAERSHPNAAYQLGLAYLSGDWVGRDVQLAAKWFERSAQSGNLLAARTLIAVRTGKGSETLSTISNTSD